MVIPTLSTNAHMALAELASGERVARIHTQYKQGNSVLNVVSYGIPARQKVMHIIRDGRECLAFEVKDVTPYSMREAIQQGQEILKSL